MRVTPGTIALIVLGDAVLVVGALALGGVLDLGATVAILFIALGLACNTLGILQIVAASRHP
jgi:hypothetical protein